MNRPSVLAGLLLAIALAAPGAQAQAPAPAAAPPPPPSSPSTAPALPLSDSLQGGAKQAYESARLLAQNSDLAGALAEFTEAYTLSKDARLLYNMAICEKGLHHYARMKSVLEQYLTEGGSSIPAENRAAVEEAVSAIKSLVAGILVTANESGAEVQLDGQTVGTTPMTSPLPVDLGHHHLTIKKAGFETEERTVDAPGGTQVQVVLALKAVRHFSQLTVTSDAAATIVVDGRSMAQGRFDGSLDPGPHHLSVTEQGKQPYGADVDLRDGETRTLQVSLEDEKHGGSAWPWILGGVAVAAGAAVGGYFLLKPQTQTAPVPPGTFGGVQFASWGR